LTYFSIFGMPSFREDYMLKYKLFILSFLCVFSQINLLQGEIESVEIFWRHGACQYNCTKLLEERLREAPQIESVTTSTTSNMASLKWKKNERFDYRLVKRPFQRVGVGIDNIRLKVKGTISPSQNRIVLVSLEDNTNFDLVSIDKQGSHASKLTIDPKFKQSFLDYAKNHTTVTVEGALYQPHRSPPLYLLVERVTAADEN
jgi:hypothetical protein